MEKGGGETLDLVLMYVEGRFPKKNKKQKKGREKEGKRKRKRKKKDVTDKIILTAYVV